MAAKPETIDEYFAGLSKENRAALEKVRKDIKAVAPKAVECISYQLPSFRLEGRLLISFGGWQTHCALYPGSRPIEVHKDALKSYDTSKGTIRFSTDRPLPTSLVKKLVKTAIDVNATRRPAKKKSPKKR